MFAREQIQAFARKREQAAAQVAAVQQQLVAVTKQRDAKASGTASARPKPSTNLPRVAQGKRQRASRAPVRTPDQITPVVLV